MDKIRSIRQRLRLLSIIIFFVLFLLATTTILLANLANSSYHQKTISQNDWNTQQITTALKTNFNNYSNVLYMGRGYLESQPNATQTDWANFFNSQSIFNRYPGISSIAYIQLVSSDQKAAFIAQKRQDPIFGKDYTIIPAGSRPVYAVSSLSEGGGDVRPTGFDVYSSADRKVIYDSAAQSGATTASEQFELSSGSFGMFILLPVSQDGITTGFVNVSLRSSDFLDGITDQTQLRTIAFHLTDVTDPAHPETIYSAGNWGNNKSDLLRTDTISFGGRRWRIDYRTPLSYAQGLVTSYLSSIILGVGLLLILVLLLGMQTSTRLTKRLSSRNSKTEQ